MKISQTFQGGKELAAAIAELRQATARTAIYRALDKAAAPVDAAWRAKAPVAKGRLKRSGGVVKVTSSIGDAAFSAAKRDGADLAGAVQAKRDALRESKADRAFAEVAIGPGRISDVEQQEYGNAHHGPQPFLRPAWEETKDQAFTILRTEATAEVAKAAARVRARAKKF